MLKIYVCEENPKERKAISDIITKTICMEEYDMALVLATGSPHQLLKKVRETPSAAVYFLDAELNSDINGIELALRIRLLDPRGFIIFIASHKDLFPLMFQYKLEVMDCIDKNEFRRLPERVFDCLKRANELYTALTNTVHKLFRFKVGSQLITLPMDSTLYFETSPSSHRIIAHTLNQTTEFYGSIRKLTLQADERFLLSHRSCLVNRDFILSVDFVRLQICLANGEICPVSVRQLKLFK